MLVFDGVLLIFFGICFVFLKTHPYVLTDVKAVFTCRVIGYISGCHCIHSKLGLNENF